MKIVNGYIKRIKDFEFKLPLSQRVNVKVKIGESIKNRDILFEKEDKKVLETYSLKKELLLNNENPREFVVRLNGEFVKKGEILAERLTRAGLIVKKVYATCDGILSYDRLSQGYLDILSEHEIVKVESKFFGKINDIIYGRHLSIKANALVLSALTSSDYVEGEFVIIQKGDSVYTARDLEQDYSGKIVFAGRFAYVSLINEILKRGASRVVVWSMDYNDYSYIKNQVIVVGGFGQIPFDYAISSHVKSLNNSYLSINNNQLVWADTGQLLLNENKHIVKTDLKINDIVRVFDLDYFNSLGKIIDNPNGDGYYTVQINSTSRVLLSREVLYPID